MSDLFYPWSWLNNKARHIRNSILERWNIILERQNDNEHAIHKYLAEYGNLFFVDNQLSFFVISKMRLGADLIPDLVVASDHRSYGVGYNFIELKKPSDRPFTKDGHASASLSRAIQQCLSYKQWLHHHIREASKRLCFLVDGEYIDRMFSFSIYIGRRDEMVKWRNERQILSSTLQIPIRSYDALTDDLAGRAFGDTLLHAFSDTRELTPQMQNQLANPFVRAFSDREWAGYLKEKKYIAHIIGREAETTLKWRRYSGANKRFMMFVKKHGGPFSNLDFS